MPIPFWAGYYIGLPFVEHGRDIRGLDCWGLVRLVLAEQFNISVPSYTRHYQHTMSEDEISTLIPNVAAGWQNIPSGAEQQGDVIVLRLRNQPMHVGMVLGDSTMLHIERYINSALESYAARRWCSRVLGFYRHKSILYDDTKKFTAL